MQLIEWLKAPGWTGAPHWHLALTATLAALLLTSEVLSWVKRPRAAGIIQLIANAIVSRWGSDIRWIGPLVSFFANLDRELRNP